MCALEGLTHCSLETCLTEPCSNTEEWIVLVFLSTNAIWSQEMRLTKETNGWNSLSPLRLRGTRQIQKYIKNNQELYLHSWNIELLC